MKTDSQKKVRILIVTPEMTFLPHRKDASFQLTGARAGGLADVSAFLIHALNDLGMDAQVAIPYYRNIFDKSTIAASKAGGRRRYERLPATSIHFARDRSFFYQPKVSGLPVWENVKMSLAFQREVINRIIPEVQPDLIHCFDWMTGLIPAMTRQYKIPCLFTLYNLLSFKTTLAVIEEHGIDAAAFWQHCYYERMPTDYHETRAANPVDFMMSGVFSAHFVNTVSTNFSRQLLEEALPFIEPALKRELQHKHASGCLIAIDHAPDPSCNPAADRFIFRPYAPEDHQTGKAANKRHLQERLGMPIDAGAPLFFWPTRLDRVRAGCPLILKTLPALLERFENHKPQIVFIADGDFQPDLRSLVGTVKAGGRVQVSDFDAGLQRLAYAAADFVLIPVEYEPCGLTCKISQRYGALPIVYDSGTVQNTIVHLDCDNTAGNGFVFNNLDPDGILWAVDQSLAFYRHPAAFKAAHIQRIMTESFERYEYARTIEQYITLYQSMLQRVFVHS